MPQLSASLLLSLLISDEHSPKQGSHVQAASREWACWAISKNTAVQKTNSYYSLLCFHLLLELLLMLHLDMVLI